jgi:hypothetical protein
VPRICQPEFAPILFLGLREDTLGAHKTRHKDDSQVELKAVSLFFRVQLLCDLTLNQVQNMVYRPRV